MRITRGWFILLSSFEAATACGKQRKTLQMFYLSVAVLAVLLMNAPAPAQEYRGTIQGNVSDGKGYSIGGASVEAKSGEQSYNVTSDGKGYVVIPYVRMRGSAEGSSQKPIETPVISSDFVS